MANQPTYIPTDLKFPPIPVASGDTLTTDAATSAVVGMTVTVHLGDGTDREVALEYRFGGWWIPTDALTA